MFGDGVLVVANLQLEPEVGHKLNLGVMLDSGPTRSGAWQGELNRFWRNLDQLIVLIGGDRSSSYQNVLAARSQGLEAAAHWDAPGELLGLDGNVTYQSFRNTSDEGAFLDFEGDRIPNRPYFFANGSARLAHQGVSAPHDELSLEYHLRYVHQLYRGWESAGRPELKQTIDSQLTHTLGLTYLIRGEVVTPSFSGEVQNLTDERVYDYFGVQRPGRAAYFKVSAKL